MILAINARFAQTVPIETNRNRPRVSQALGNVGAAHLSNTPRGLRPPQDDANLAAEELFAERPE